MRSAGLQRCGVSCPAHDEIALRQFYFVQGASGRFKGAGSCSYTTYRAPGTWQIDRCPCNRFFPFKYRKTPSSFVTMQAIDPSLLTLERLRSLVLLRLLPIWQAKFLRDENPMPLQAMHRRPAGMLLLGRVWSWEHSGRALLRRLHSLLHRRVGVQLLSVSVLLSLDELWLRVLRV